MALDLFANKKGLLIAGGIGLVALMAGRKGITLDSGNPNITLNPKFANPVKIQPGDQVSTHWYRVGAARRDGMTYVPVSGLVGERVTFNGPSTGVMYFTWLVVDEGGVLYAEFSPRES